MALVSDMSEGPGWWIASDGKWYPPHLHPRDAFSDAPLPEQPGAASPGAMALGDGAPGDTQWGSDSGHNLPPTDGYSGTPVSPPDAGPTAKRGRRPPAAVASLVVVVVVIIGALTIFGGVASGVQGPRS